MQSQQLISLLQRKGIVFADGLTDQELTAVEAKFGLKFPEDLLALLCTKLPISEGFVDWRKALASGDYSDKVLERIDWPLEGMLFDVENSGFWIEDWGEKPEAPIRQKEVAKNNFRKYPQLVPIYSHRYIPSQPSEAGNPVFSVYQTDIVCYGNNLAAYLSKEFDLRLPSDFDIPQQPRHIFFWSDLL